MHNSQDGIPNSQDGIPNSQDGIPKNCKKSTSRLIEKPQLKIIF